MHGIWAQDKSFSIKVYSVYLKETLIQRKFSGSVEVSSFTEEFPQSAVSLDSALLSSHHSQENGRGKTQDRGGGGGDGLCPGGKPEIPGDPSPGQECLSGLEDSALSL